MKYIKRIFENKLDFLDLSHEFQSTIDFIEESDYCTHEISGDTITFEFYEFPEEFINSKNIDEFKTYSRYYKFRADFFNNITEVCNKLVDLGYDIQCECTKEPEVAITITKEVKDLEASDFIIPIYSDTNRLIKYIFRKLKFENWFRLSFGTGCYCVQYRPTNQYGRKKQVYSIDVNIVDESMTPEQIKVFIEKLNTKDIKVTANILPRKITLVFENYVELN